MAMRSHASGREARSTRTHCSLLASIVGDGTCLANTSHHQSVDKIGEGAEITAYSPTDNIVESFELKEYPFGLALQWHPEVIHEEPKQLAIFQALVKAASQSQGT